MGRQGGAGATRHARSHGAACCDCDREQGRPGRPHRRSTNHSVAEPVGVQGPRAPDTPPPGRRLKRAAPKCFCPGAVSRLCMRRSAARKNRTSGASAAAIGPGATRVFDPDVRRTGIPTGAAASRLVLADISDASPASGHAVLDSPDESWSCPRLASPCERVPMGGRVVTGSPGGSGPRAHEVGCGVGARTWLAPAGRSRLAGTRCSVKSSHGMSLRTRRSPLTARRTVTKSDMNTCADCAWWSGWMFRFQLARSRERGRSRAGSGGGASFSAE